MMDISPKRLRDWRAALPGARSIAYPSDMSQSLRAVRLAPQPLVTLLRGVQ